MLPPAIFFADCQYLSPILLSGPNMADSQEQVTSADAMRNLLSSARVPDILVEHILGLGFEDIADFAYAYADASDLGKLLECRPKHGPPWASQIQNTQYLRHALEELLSWPRPPLRKNPWPWRQQHL